MSCNRENATWKGRDGKWNIGFFHCYPVGDQFDEDWDYEWDVDYDFDSFDWVSTGHRSEAEARDAYGGANPGGTDLHEEPSAITNRFDEMAKKYLAEHPRRSVYY